MKNGAENAKAAIEDINKANTDDIENRFNAMAQYAQSLVSSAEAWAKILKIANGGSGLKINYVFEEGIYGNKENKEEYINALRGVQGQLSYASSIAQGAAGFYRGQAADIAADPNKGTNSAEYWEALGNAASNEASAAQMNLQMWEIASQIDQVEIEHFDAIKREWESRSGISESLQGINDAIIQQLKTQGVELNLGEATFNAEIRGQIGDKLLKQYDITETLREEYAKLEEQLENIKKTFDERSAEYREKVAELNQVGQQIVEAETEQMTLLQELNNTFVEEFNALIDSYDRAVQVREGEAAIPSSLAELYKTMGEATYRSGVGESTYEKQVAEQMQVQKQLDQQTSDLRLKEMDEAARSFANIAVRYGKDSEQYQTA